MNLLSTLGRQRWLIQISLFLSFAFLIEGQPSLQASRGGGAIAAQSPAAQPPPGASFEWISLEDSAGTTALTIDGPEAYVVHLQHDGTLGVRADCNWRAASYDSSADSLTLGPMLGNPGACPGDSLSHRFMELLADTARIDLQPDGSLSILHRSGARLTFRPHQVQS